MDLPGLVSVLERLHAGTLRCVSRDTPEPSVFAHEILNARPYAFLDDAPLEERRAHAVYARRTGEPGAAALGALDSAASERVRGEQQPGPRDADELHDALVTVGILPAREADLIPGGLFDALVQSRRATVAALESAASSWIAAERLPEILAVHPNAVLQPPIAAPPSRAAKQWERNAAIVELVRDPRPRRQRS